MDIESIGSYTELDPIGKGGMGIVYKAQNPDSMLTPVVAIKVLFGDFTDDERARFLREARVAYDLRHENIVTVLDLKEIVVDDEFGERRVPYIVMEFLSGVDLQTRLASRDFDTLEERIDLMIGIGRGLAFAHAKGIIHRDMKPSNIQITEDGLPKILDFGVARTQGSDLTATGMQPGTPNYMSPEQILGQEIDQRSDVFSVGSVFYELLSYRRAFDGKLDVAAVKVVEEQPTPLAGVVRYVPEDLCDLVHRMLEKDPAKRPQTMKEIIADLEAVRRDLPERFAAIRSQTVEYLQQIEALKEEHPAVLDPNNIGDAESTLLLGSKVSIDPSEEATLVISVSPPSYIEVWNDHQQARNELERLRAIVGGRPVPEAPAEPEPAVEEDVDSGGASSLLDAIKSTGEFVFDSSKRVLVAARRVMGRVHKER